MKCDDFIQELFMLTAKYDGDGKGLCGENHEYVVEILKRNILLFFESYEMIKGVKKGQVLVDIFKQA